MNVQHRRKQQQRTEQGQSAQPRGTNTGGEHTEAAPPPRRSSEAYTLPWRNDTPGYQE